ncbi:MAG TPA: hypothetical protein DGH68_12860 [Bacteroidetes bacterium]|nr:hypothetical protein [Bacteroidota bacterium]
MIVKVEHLHETVGEKIVSYRRSNDNDRNRHINRLSTLPIYVHSALQETEPGQMSEADRGAAYFPHFLHNNPAVLIFAYQHPNE